MNVRDLVLNELDIVRFLAKQAEKDVQERRAANPRSDYLVGIAEGRKIGYDMASRRLSELANKLEGGVR